MATSKRTCVAGALVLVMVGCDSDDGAAAAGAAGDGDFGAGVVQARDAVWNDWRLNDWRLNDWRLNASRFNNSKLNGDTANDWIQIFDFWLPNGGSSLTGNLQGGMLRIDTSSGWLEEWDVEGTIITYKIKKNGVTTTKEVWLKWAKELGAYSGVWAYDADIRTNGGSWSPLCTDASGNRTDTLLIGDAWNPTNGAKITPRPTNVITYACRTAALAKCVEFGYKPWATKNGTALADHHQACTRMVRADYCGDSTPHTATGTSIHVLDQLGIQNQAQGVTYAVEAEWGPNGATCLNPGNTRLPNQTIGCNIPTCGAPFASGGLIQSGKI